uniref:Uncharacterized protein n=1 Tax=Heterorhabditis bacteriophora TaxID=37862 RepID=A0A1I7WA13_HETBA
MQWKWCLLRWSLRLQRNAMFALIGVKLRTVTVMDAVEMKEDGWEKDASWII